MSSPPPYERDQARPIPQTSRPGPGPSTAPDGEDFVVDTRRRAPMRVPRGAGQGGQGRAPSPTQPPAAQPRRTARPAAAQSRPSGPPRTPGGTTRPPAGDRRPAGPTGSAGQRTSGRVRRRRIVVLVALVLAAWVAFLIWVPLNAWSNVTRVDWTPTGDRPAVGGGRTYLLVGSDSRAGLTPEQEQALSTGPDEGGQRTDTIMLVHVSNSGGKPSIISIPRDSYVPIPGKGSNKINAAFAFGGPKLLATTIEQVTGVHLDGYLEIGFGGFASIVDAIGGVNLCVAAPMNDPLAGINLSPGCQDMNGPTALGYVRSRHTDPLGDLGRAQRQRAFLGAVMKKVATPANVLVPWRYKSTADAMVVGLTAGNDTSMADAARILIALRAVSNGDGLSLQVPVSNPNLQTPAGSSVKWDTERAKALFAAIQKDEALTVPPAGTQPGQT